MKEAMGCLKSLGEIGGAVFIWGLVSIGALLGFIFICFGFLKRLANSR